VGFAPDSLSWVFNAYVIAFGGLLLLGGRLSDLLGAKRMFSLGWAVLAPAHWPPASPAPPAWRSLHVPSKAPVQP
jgi:MFS family permease